MTDDARVRGRVIVIGDVMLDRSEHGEAHRLSPEAPVVVLLNPVASSVLGGAGNTAANVRSLGLSTSLFAVVGNDESGKECATLAEESGIDVFFVSSNEIPTTTKTRYLANLHQVMRKDVEVSHVPSICQEDLLALLKQQHRGAQSLVISDYGKGLIVPDFAQALIQLALKSRIPVIVDTKRTDVSCYRGCTVIAPNHHEAERMTGSSDPESAARLISESTESAVLITLGADGMLLFHRGETVRIASNAKAVADVTGAGDTVTAGLAVALAEGASLRQAAEWANWAAAEAVSHPGTYAVPRAAVNEQVAKLTQ